MSLQPRQSLLLVNETTVDAHTLNQTARTALNLLVAAGRIALPAGGTERWVERIAAALGCNIASGRFALACWYDRARPRTLLEYAQEVAINLFADWERVEALRRGDDLRWGVELQRLEWKAYVLLGPHGREIWAAGEAGELASHTCADLWNWLQTHPFPFDVSFDRWSERALRNRLYTAARHRRVVERHTVDSLDRVVFVDGSTLGDRLVGDNLACWLERETNRETVRGALAWLEPRKARVIRLWYLEGWSAVEIAAALNVEVKQVYVLRCRGLKQLRKMCAKDKSVG